MKFFLLFLPILTIIYAQNVKLAVAANVSYVIDDLIKEYKKEHNLTKITLSIGSSGKLAAQILNGAPYDIFLSANKEYPQRLYEKGVSKVPPKVYAKGRLVLFSTKDIDISSGLDSLLNKDIKKVAIANDKTAPYGKATKEALIKKGLYEKLKPKFIYGESIGQTLIFTLKAADAGVVAKSLLYSKKMQKYKNFVDINSSLYTPIEQASLLINQTKEAKEFYNFLFSKEAKEIFKRYGYIVE